MLIKEHWFAKNELNSSAIFFKYVICSLFSNSIGIHGIFFPIKKLFKMDQQVLKRLPVSDNVLVICK